MRLAPEEPSPGAGVALAPIIVRDLNADGYPEIILGGVNTVFVNEGGFKFKQRALFTDPPRIMVNTGLVEDLTGDGLLDFVGVDPGERPGCWRAGKAAHLHPKLGGLGKKSRLAQVPSRRVMSITTEISISGSRNTSSLTRAARCPPRFMTPTMATRPICC